MYAIKPSLPAVGGNEGTGEITEVGSEVETLQRGDQVVLKADQCLGNQQRSFLVFRSKLLTNCPCTFFLPI